MVKVDTRKVILKRKPNSNDGEARLIEIETSLIDYGTTSIEGTDVEISVAVAIFELKKEDRHVVLDIGSDKQFNDCYKRTASKQKLAAIFGVFDGHDGDSASSYCAKGLAPHIMAELDVRCSSTPTQRKSWSFSNDKAMAALDFETTRPAQNGDIELSYIAAFQNAQQRFCNYMDPPRFEEVCNHLPLKTNHWKSYNPINWLGSSTPSRRGGTTACTLSLFTETHHNSCRIVPDVVVANTGDSRLLTDDATGTSNFRQLTTDHRPNDPAERRRLAACVARGEAFIHNSFECRDIRIFPGGLAVSRTIGDGGCSRSVICTPEVTHVPLKISKEEGQEKIQRFVMGTDGLYDALSNSAVGKAAAREPSRLSDRKINENNDDLSNSSHQNEKTGAPTPKHAACKILEQCLKAGGNQDDVTICVIDVNYK